MVSHIDKSSRIMFIREFSIIDSATSPERLRMRLKDQELEEYGEAFTPEFVYEVIRRLPKFSSMRVGLCLYLLPPTITDVHSEVINKTPRSFWGFYWKSYMKNASVL